MPDSTKRTGEDDIAARIMAAMAKMPPKKHEEMTVGRGADKEKSRPARGR